MTAQKANQKAEMDRAKGLPRLKWIGQKKANQGSKGQCKRLTRAQTDKCVASQLAQKDQRESTRAKKKIRQSQPGLERTMLRVSQC